MNLNTLKTGDLIVRKKGPFSTHYIVYIGWCYGIQLVAENQTGVGVRYTSLQEALAGNSIERFEPFGGTESQRQLVISRVDHLLKRSYDLVVFNCEHFARWIANGKKESKQEKKFSNGLLMLGALMASNRNKTIRAVGVLFLILGGFGYISQL